MSLYRTFSKVAVAAGALMLVAGCSGRKEVAIAAKDQQLRQQETQLAQERAEKQKAMEMNEALNAQNRELAEKNAVATQQTAQKVDALNRQMADLEGLIRDLKLNQVKAGSGVPDGDTAAISQQKDGIHLTVAGSALFDSGKAELKTSSHDMLLKVAKTIKTRFPQNYLRIEGHTDSTPVVHSKEKFKDNMALSIVRARAVYDFLVKEGGIAATKMYTAGYGEHQPLVHPEKSAADRAKNRRVEIVIMPTDLKVQKESLAKK
jgi:chemotaxis protein MotB